MLNEDLAKVGTTESRWDEKNQHDTVISGYKLYRKDIEEWAEGSPYGVAMYSKERA